MKKYDCLLLLVCICFPWEMRGQTPEMDNPVYTSPWNEGGEIKGCQSVTLGPGFQFTAAPGKSLRVVADPTICSPNISKSVELGGNTNYIVKITPLDKMATANFDGTSFSLTRNARALTEIRYFDGLGRLTQTVQCGVTPMGNDLVSLQEYDALGREAKVWLPTPLASNGGFTDVAAFRSTATSFFADGRPFSEPVYENSPLNRVTAQIGPGQNFASHPVRSTFEINDNTNGSELSCKFLVMSDETHFMKKGNYNAGELFVTRKVNEDGYAVLEFTDKLGQVVLSRQIAGAEFHDTYFVYDDLGNRCFVLPPLCADAVTADNVSMGVTSTPVAQFAYFYRYDNRKRCVESKWPGSEPVHNIYDKADRLILSQSGNQRYSNEWTFLKYDALGRMIVTGYTILPPAQAQQLREQYAQEVLVESLTSSGRYTENHPLGNAAVVFNTSYYDNYLFLTGISGAQEMAFAPESGYASSIANATGLLTGSFTRSISDTTTTICIVHYYDTRGREVQTRATNHLGGTEVYHCAYSFTGAVSQSKAVHTLPPPGQTITECYRYEYDHAGRSTNTFYTLNNSPEINLCAQEYDELGRLSRQQLSTADTVQYTYNIRNWTKVIDSRNFTQHLFYEDAPEGATPSYSGNISAYQWKHAGENINTYHFTYDGLSRMTKGIYKGGYAPENAFNEEFTYDKMGNIRTLKRRGTISSPDAPSPTYGLLDDATLYYTGNQRGSVCDQSLVDTYGTNILPGNNWSGYDNNGNMNYFESEWGTPNCPSGGYTIQYNRLNLPEELITLDYDRNTSRYMYTADGVKRRVTHATALNPLHIPLGTSVAERSSTALYDTLTIDYAGNKIYRNGVLQMILNSYGYMAPDELGVMRSHVYLRDHQGNNRTVLREKTVIEKNDYYPFGMEFGNRPNNNRQPYKYNGKEIQLMHGFNHYDYSARMMGFSTGSFSTPDPLAEKYFPISPYAYCANNPVRFIDPDGKDIWEIDSSGQIVSKSKNNSRDAFFMVEKDADGKYQRTYTIDDKGNKKYNSISFKYGTVKAREQVIKTDKGEATLNIFEIKGDENASNAFSFLAQSDVEWGHTKIGSDKSGRNLVGTSNDDSGSYVGNYTLQYGYSIRESNHSHPSGTTTPSESDVNNAKSITNKFKDAKFNILIKPNTLVPFTKNSDYIIHDEINKKNIKMSGKKW